MFSLPTSVISYITITELNDSFKLIKFNYVSCSLIKFLTMFITLRTRVCFCYVFTWARLRVSSMYVIVPVFRKRECNVCCVNVNMWCVNVNVWCVARRRRRWWVRSESEVRAVWWSARATTTTNNRNDNLFFNSYLQDESHPPHPLTISS